MLHSDFVKITCADYSGTAIRINDSSFLTAHHLFYDSCVPIIDGKILEVVKIDPKADLVLLGSIPKTDKFSCNSDFQSATAYGYAEGSNTYIMSTAIDYSEGIHHVILQNFLDKNKFDVALSTVFEGMSGGPLKNNHNGKIIGMISAQAYDHNYLIYVSGSTICDFLGIKE